jgi:hypothetical protein
MCSLPRAGAFAGGRSGTTESGTGRLSGDCGAERSEGVALEGADRGDAEAPGAGPALPGAVPGSTGAQEDKTSIAGNAADRHILRTKPGIGALGASFRPAEFSAGSLIASHSPSSRVPRMLACPRGEVDSFSHPGTARKEGIFKTEIW